MLEANSNVLLQEILTHWDERRTLESIPRFRKLTEESQEQRLQIWAELIPVLCTMGQQGVAGQLRSEAVELSTGSAELAGWAMFVEMNWLIANAEFVKSIELCSEIVRSDAASPELKFHSELSILTSHGAMLNIKGVIETANRILPHCVDAVSEFQLSLRLGKSLCEAMMISESLKYIHRAKELAPDLGGNHRTAEVLYAIGYVKGFEARINRPHFAEFIAESISYMQQASDLLEHTSNHALNAYILADLTEANIYRGELGEALTASGAALNHAERSGQNRMIAIAHVARGDVAWQCSELSLARVHFEAGLSILAYPFQYSGILINGMLSTLSSDREPEEAFRYRVMHEEWTYRAYASQMEAVNVLVHLLKEREMALEQERVAMQRTRTERELANATLQLITQTELLSELRNDLLQITRKISPTEPAARELRDRLKDLPCKSVDWQKFESEFAAVHPVFKHKLVEKYPLLSPAEVRICILLRLNLKSHEIAQLTCLSERSVEDHRYQIRKKLAVQRGENVVDHLGRV